MEFLVPVAHAFRQKENSTQEFLKISPPRVASHLAERAEECAASLKIEALYLLTITAEGFFAKRGYHRVERDSAPSSVRETAEFKNLCPASAVCMVKYLKMK